MHAFYAHDAQTRTDIPRESPARERRAERAQERDILRAGEEVYGAFISR